MGCPPFLQLKSKIEKSTTELFKLNSLWEPYERGHNIQIQTNEKIECLRRIRSKMNISLVLGRSHQIQYYWIFLIPHQFATRLVYTQISNSYLFHFLGRRRVFGVLMEGLHQHWKDREVAKMITMYKIFFT